MSNQTLTQQSQCTVKHIHQELYQRTLAPHYLPDLPQHINNLRMPVALTSSEKDALKYHQTQLAKLETWSTLLFAFLMTIFLLALFLIRESGSSNFKYGSLELLALGFCLYALLWLVHGRLLQTISRPFAESIAIGALVYCLSILDKDQALVTLADKRRVIRYLTLATRNTVQISEILAISDPHNSQQNNNIWQLAMFIYSCTSQVALPVSQTVNTLREKIGDVLCQYYLTGQHGKFTYEPDESLTLPGEQLRSNLVLLVTYILLAWTFILLFPLFPFPNWGKFIIIGGMGVVMVDQLTGAKILAQFMLNRIKKDETYFVESRYEELGEMVTAEQAAWTVLLEAFKLIGGELKQRWEFARKKEDEQEANEQQYEPGVAEDLANAIKSNLNLVEESQLRMLTNDLETAIKLAQGFNKKRNLYREQLPNAIDIVPIRIQIDEAEGERDKAVVEIKEILEKMAGENIVTNASMV